MMNAFSTHLSSSVNSDKSHRADFLATLRQCRISKAFSLVELLAAVTIVGIMAFFAIPQVTRMRGDAEVNLAISRAA
jgi:prepilin-type N-terminal cleavage/methylation domain-containing protein